MEDQPKPSLLERSVMEEPRAGSMLAKVFNWTMDYSMVVVFLLLILLSSLFSPYFFSWSNFSNILRQVSFNGIVSIGVW
jgi:ribose/xylose/arabinose/galactoside ABC-type transport system permease subunit